MTNECVWSKRVQKDCPKAWGKQEQDEQLKSQGYDDQLHGTRQQPSAAPTRSKQAAVSIKYLQTAVVVVCSGSNDIWH